MESDDSEPGDAPPAASRPADAEGWRAVLAAIPTRELLRLVQKDKARASRLFSGFRAAPDALRHPLVASRLIEEAQKQPAFAQEIIDWTPTAVPAAAPPPKQAPAVPPAKEPESKEPTTEPRLRGERRLREKLNEQRTALREKEERLTGLEERLSRLQRERDATRIDAETARAEAQTLKAQAERLRRQQERAERRPQVAAAAAPPAPAKAAMPPAAPPPPPPVRPSVWEEALRRLASRGKHEIVAEVCREALAAGSDALGPVHALYAEALYAQEQSQRGAEQDQQAMNAYLDMGDIGASAASFVRALSHANKFSYTAFLARLLALAKRTGQEEAVRAAFARLRTTNAPAYQRLTEILTERGEGGAAAAFLPPARSPQVGPEEAIALPMRGIDAVTPRQLVSAVETNARHLVLRARQGIDALKSADSALAEALLQAVGLLHSPSVIPLTQPTRPVVVDASNVARHDPDPLALTPLLRVEHLLRMRDHLLQKGFFPVLLIADANLRFHVDDGETYRSLVGRGVIRETAPGTAADAALIAEAREQDAPLVTNDRLWDWEEEAREVRRIGFGILPDTISLYNFSH